MPIVLLAILASIAWYVWLRLIRDPAWPRPRRSLLTVLYLAAVMAALAAVSSDEGPSRGDPGAARIVGLIAFSAWLHLAVCFCAVGLAKRVAAVARRRIPTHREPPAHPEPALDRRQFLARATAAGVGMTATATSMVGYRNAWDITLPEIPVRLERLPKALDGFRIVQWSDLHLGRLLGAAFLERVVELTERRRPDVVVITGDLIEGLVDRRAGELAPLRGLAERYRVYYTTGNHEYYAHDAARWVEVLTRMGARVLTNERVVLGDSRPGGASFDLAGIPDRIAGDWLASHTPDVSAALAGRDAERELVLLAHQPAQIAHTARHGVGLQLSGHTHGGQFFPFGVLVRLAEPYVAGLHRHDDGTQIYVSRGTGFFGPAIRTLAPAELPLIVLTT